MYLAKISIYTFRDDVRIYDWYHISRKIPGFPGKILETLKTSIFESVDNLTAHFSTLSRSWCIFKASKNAINEKFCHSVPIDCVVLFLVILALVFLLKQCPVILCGTNAIGPFLTDSRNLYLPTLLERLRCAQRPCWALSLHTKLKKTIT